MSPTVEKNTGLAKSAATVSVAVMFSRVLGLIREQVFAILFGAGYAYDAFVVAFRIPNLLRDLFGEGALSAAFVTVFSDYKANRKAEDMWQLASTVLCFFAIALSVIVIAGAAAAGSLVSLLAPDFALIPGKTELTSSMTIIMMPFLMLVSFSAVVMGMLNTHGRFFVPAMASSFFNLGSIIGGTALAFILPKFGYPAIIGMAFGTLIGGMLQLSVQIPTLRKTGFHFQPSLRFSDPGLKKILMLMIPATIGLSATQINIFINTNFAASCAEGSVSWLNYSFRLVQLPIGLFGVAISIAALPMLARQASRKEFEDMRQTFASALSLVFCLTVPATVGLIVLAEPIIRVIFEHGAFTAKDTSATAVALSLYAVGLFAYAANKVIVPVFYAINAARYPVIASFGAIGVNICIVLLTIEQFQHRAIAFSTSITMIANFLFLTIVLYNKLDHFPLRSVVSGILKITAASAVMGIMLIAARTFAEPYCTANLIVQILFIAILIPTAAIIYLITLRLLSFPELHELLDILSKVRNRIRGH